MKRRNTFCLLNNLGSLTLIFYLNLKVSQFEVLVVPIYKNECFYVILSVLAKLYKNSVILSTVVSYTLYTSTNKLPIMLLKLTKLYIHHLLYFS